MSQKLNITIDKTSELLQEKFGGEVSQLTLLNGGEWSQAYSFVRDDQKYVLRWCKSSESFEKDAFAANFSSLELPIPTISHQGKKFGEFYAISVFVPGSFVETITPSQLELTLPALYKLFDALRLTDLSKTTGYGLWDAHGEGSHTSWKEFLLDVKNDHESSITHGWRKHLENQPEINEQFDQLFARLEKIIEACPQIRELIHSDLLNYNLLVLNQEISGVIDWQCSMYGDSLYDIAWFLYYEPWYPQFKTISLREKIIAYYSKSATNTQNINKRLLCYYLHIGLDSIAYNAFKKDWKAAKDAAEYTLKLVKDQV